MINADNSGDEVQEIGYTPKKSKQAEFYNVKTNETPRGNSNEDEPEIIITQTQKTPLSQRNTDNQKKNVNSQMKTPDNTARKQDGIRTSNYQSNDDKSLELKKTADSQLNSILNISDFKSNDLGAASQFLYLLFPNQPQLTLGNPFGVNNILTANGPRMFTQDFSPFSQLINPDPSNLLFQANNPLYFGNAGLGLGHLGNGALMQAARINTANIPQMEEPKKQQLLQNSHQATASLQSKNLSGQKPQHSNAESLMFNQLNSRNVEANSMTDENDVESNSVSKSAAKGGAIDLAKKRRMRQCFNKFCLTDPENASLWSKTRVTGKMSCKICEEAWKNQHFCYFCKQIYLEEGKASADPKPWIGCDSCERWNHTDCEDKALQKKIKWHQDRDEDFEYKCPHCRPKTRTPARGKPRRSIPVSQMMNENSRTGFEQSANEEFEEEPMRKQVKLQPDSPEMKYSEFNANSNSNLMINTADETCIAKRKLENMFNKHMQKRRFQIGKPMVHVDTYAVIDSLLNQHGKKLQLSENEVQHDLMMMRDASKASCSDNSSPMEEENFNGANFRNNMYLEDDKKSGTRSRNQRPRGAGNARRSNATDKSFQDMQEETQQNEDVDTEYVPGVQIKRNTRDKR